MPCEPSRYSLASSSCVCSATAGQMILLVAPECVLHTVRKTELSFDATTGIYSSKDPPAGQVREQGAVTLRGEQQGVRRRRQEVEHEEVAGG